MVQVLIKIQLLILFNIFWAALINTISSSKFCIIYYYQFLPANINYLNTHTETQDVFQWHTDTAYCFCCGADHEDTVPYITQGFLAVVGREVPGEVLPLPNSWFIFVLAIVWLLLSMALPTLFWLPSSSESSWYCTTSRECRIPWHEMSSLGTSFFFLYQAFFSVMVSTFFLIPFYCDISASHFKHPVGER